MLLEPMGRSAQRPCTWPGCGVLTDTGRCERHKRRYNVHADKRKPGERRFYDKREWRDRIRPMQLRIHPLCEGCKAEGRIAVATEVDHRDGNPENNTSANLSSLCKPCHSRKTVREDGAFGPGGGSIP